MPRIGERLRRRHLVVQRLRGGSERRRAARPTIPAMRTCEVMRDILRTPLPRLAPARPTGTSGRSRRGSSAPDFARHERRPARPTSATAATASRTACALPKSTSATPSPSVPGSHAATSAFQLGSCASTTSGRPGDQHDDDRDRAPFRLSSAIWSAPSRSRPSERSPFALRVRRLAQTAIADVVGPVDAGAVGAVVDVPFEPTACLMPCRIDVPGVIGPTEPCQRDRPAAGLVADVVRALAGHEDLARPGQRQDVPAFFSTTCDSADGLAGERAVRRRADRRRCSVRSANGCSNRPSSNFLRQDAADRVVDPRLRDLGRPGPRACSSAMKPCESCGTITMSMPALIAVVDLGGGEAGRRRRSGRRRPSREIDEAR